MEAETRPDGQMHMGQEAGGEIDQDPSTPILSATQGQAPGPAEEYSLLSRVATQVSESSVKSQDQLSLGDKLARTPTSDAYSTTLSEPSRSATASPEYFPTVEGDQSSYFASKLTEYQASFTSLPRITSASDVSSPLNSGHSSSVSLPNSHASNYPVNDSRDQFLGLSSNIPAPYTQTIIATPKLPGTVPQSTVSVIPRQVSLHTRRDVPHYPHQYFTALQSQVYPSGYPTHPLRTRSSHPSQNASHSSGGSSKGSRDRSSVVSGAKTAGHTPAQSPGLFNSPTPKARPTSDTSDDGHNTTPLLHSTHLQAPKETHKLLKDIDPISGRKIVNNYEFQAKLGSGTHGTVKLGRNLHTGELVAIKIVRRFSKKVRLGKQESPEDKVKKEVAVLKKARHPHVVSLLEVIDDQEFGKVYLILEYVELGEIIWRKRTEKDIAMFEMNRVQREMSGNVRFEADVVAHFNEMLAAGRVETGEAHPSNMEESLLQERLPMVEEANPPTPLTSFRTVEHIGDTMLQDNNQSQIRSNQEAMEENSGSTIGKENSYSNSITNASDEAASNPHKPTLLEPGIEQRYSLDNDERPNLSSPGFLEGTLRRAYSPEDSTGHEGKGVLPSIFDGEIAEAQTLSSEEEEYSFVPCLTLSQALEVFRDTVLGLEYLHYQGIIHRDIKPANLLWTADHRVKISDFGVSYLGKPIREDDNNEEIEEADAANLDEAIELAKTVGTPAFYAPELCDPDLFDIEKNPVRPQITGQIDVWALGVTLYGMIFGRLPFFDDNEFAMYEKIAKQEVFIPKKRLRGVEETGKVSMSSNKRLEDVLEYEDVDDELEDLLKRLLHKQPTKRITLREVKHHPWVLRGIKDHGTWIDGTDPSLQSEGKKIEVSSKEVSEAVAPLTIVDRIKSGIRRLGSVVRGRDNTRKRAESNVKGTDPSASGLPRLGAGDREGRRLSLRGNELIFSALRDSRENAEHHPLAQSLAPSPELEKIQSYFIDPSMSTESFYQSSRSSPRLQRPSIPDRTISTADSTKTIKATVPTAAVRQSTPPIHTEEIPDNTTIIESAASSSSSLGGLFGGAGRRLVRSMRSKERSHTRDSASQTSRSSSVEYFPSDFEDPHASPSVAFSSAVAEGHLDQPPVLREVSIPEVRSWDSSLSYAGFPAESSMEAFEKAQEQNYRRQINENERATAERLPRSRANTAVQCPPSPDDGLFYATHQTLQSHDVSMAVSSSDDQMTSGISESFSHPSIPSVVSGASSLSTHTEEHKGDQMTPVMDAGGTLTVGATGNQHGKRNSISVDEDEAGYNGDGDEEEEESDDDGGIMFGKR